MEVLRQVDGAQAALTEPADQVVAPIDDLIQQGIAGFYLVRLDLGERQVIALALRRVVAVDRSAIGAS